MRELVVLTVAMVLGCGAAREEVRATTPAEPETAEATAAEAAPEEDLAPRAWLYRVSGGDAAAPSYLLGTMHIGITFRAAVPSPLDSTLFDARAVAMEVDMREAMRFFREAPRVRVPRRQWIDRTLPRETFARLTTELSRVAPAEIVARLPAGLLALHFQQVRMAEVEAVEDGRTPIPGATSSARLDRSIFNWAIASGLPFVALETPEEAVAAFVTDDPTAAVDALREMIDDPEGARDAARRLRDAYRSLDEDQLLAVLGEMGAEERRMMLDVRNAAWMRNLVPLIQAGEAFVAVGAGHLVGAGSVIELLEARGYRVERVLGDGGLTPSERTDILISMR
jgi:uncharacterized protein